MDEALEQSIDYRDHEISRSLVPKNPRNAQMDYNFGKNLATHGLRQSEYKGL